MNETFINQPITAAIIDDEEAARFNIKDALRTHKHWHIVGEADNGRDALSIINDTQPDVVFLDIQMPFQNGVSLAKQLLKNRHQPIIVFVTAYDAYAVQAFELYALDYILKPFDNPRFEATIERVESLLAQPEQEQALKQHYNGYAKQDFLKRLVLRSAGSIRVINIDDIIWFSSESNYVAIHHKDGTHLHRVSLSFLEQHLDPDIFVRTHRTAIVRLEQCREIKVLTENRSIITLANGDQVGLSKAYKDVLITRLEYEK
ncbi:response regulator transcription factor [Alteromonadaceae bacterium M269]|nr:response regulator transcription factor [Alteromonadaceae bacterium M269]